MKNQNNTILMCFPYISKLSEKSKTQGENSILNLSSKQKYFCQLKKTNLQTIQKIAFTKNL